MIGPHINQKPDSRVMVGTFKASQLFEPRASFACLGADRHQSWGTSTKADCCTIDHEGEGAGGARGGARMYYDLNVPYSANHQELQLTLAFLRERKLSVDLEQFLAATDMSKKSATTASH